MLTSINPLSELGRKQRWSVTAAAYVAGSLFGGLLVFGLLGLLGSYLSVGTWGRWALIAALAIGAVFDGLSRALPGPRRQVNENWLTKYRGWVYGFGFGLQLGTGVSTIITTATVYTAMLATVIMGEPFAGVIVGLVFGFVRSLPLLRAGRLASFSEVNGLMARMERWRPWSRRIPALAQIVAAGSLLFV